jgi:hypothetical protein
MKADLTRNTFDQFKHFTRVIMQQGRVQLDADWNEQAAILLKYLQALAADLIGPHGGPIANLGFRIADGNIATDFAITPGHYYVDGILCELAPQSAPVPITKNPSGQYTVPLSSAASFTKLPQVLLCAEGLSVLTKVASVTQENVVTFPAAANTVLGKPNPRAYLEFTSFFKQTDYPLPSTSLVSGLVYLDVWERLVTYVEDDSIREVALAGADTAARSKLVCQVKLLANASSTVDLKSQFQPANRGRLMAQAKQTSTSTDPCVIAPDASYRGPENQLYRVEIHTGGMYTQSNPISPKGPTFKWSRENGSVIFPIVNLTPGSGTTTVVLENLGRDERFGLNENDWVEIQDDDYVLLNSAGTLLQVQSIESGSLTVTLAGTPAPPVGQDQSKHPLLRRWDQTAGDPAEGGLQLGLDNAALILEDSNDTNWLSLEDGIQIQFQPAAPRTSPHQYRTGDYWLIPARTATGDIEWPTGTALPPDGVDHHYAPLAAITLPESSVQVGVFLQNQFQHLPYVSPV